MATKDNLSTKQSRSAITPTGEESKIPVPQPSGLGELATSMATEAEKWLEGVQRTHISSLSGAEKMKEPQDKTPKRQLPKLATRPKRYALTLLIMLIQVAQACTWARLVIWWPFMVERLILKPASSMMKLWWLAKPLLIFPHFAKWRTKCVSISEASEIVAGCKRLEKENWRQARWELQKQFSAMQEDSTLSTMPGHFSLRLLHSCLMKMTGNLFTLQGVGGQEVVLLRALYPAHWWEGHLSVILSLQRTREYLVMPPIVTGLFARGVEVEGVRKAKVAVAPMIHAPLEGGKRRRMDFPVKSRFLNLVVRRDILMMWLTPLGSGPDVSLTTAITMRIPTSCLW